MGNGTTSSNILVLIVAMLTLFFLYRLRLHHLLNEISRNRWSVTEFNVWLYGVTIPWQPTCTQLMESQHDIRRRKKRFAYNFVCKHFRNFIRFFINTNKNLRKSASFIYLNILNSFYSKKKIHSTYIQSNCWAKQTIQNKIHKSNTGDLLNFELNRAIALYQFVIV